MYLLGVWCYCPFAENRSWNEINLNKQSSSAFHSISPLSLSLSLSLSIYPLSLSGGGWRLCRLRPIAFYNTDWSLLSLSDDSPRIASGRSTADDTIAIDSRSHTNEETINLWQIGQSESRELARCRPQRWSTFNSSTEAGTAGYLNDDQLDRDCCPLRWWAKHQLRYPSVTALVRVLLAVPATSVPSERLFSKAGDVITKKRN